MVSERIYSGMVCIDCEGPLTKNDNALELAAHFIPKGELLFKQLSRYDDVLAFMLKRPGYQAGNTLKLICPFFKAYGVRNEDIKGYSERHILIMPGADVLLNWIDCHAQGYIISTSYSVYIQALCSVTGFPFNRTYCTPLDLDIVDAPQEELQKVQEMSKQIVALPALEWSSEVRTFDGISQEAREAFATIDEFITEKIRRMAVGMYLDSLEPVGGEEKARAVKESSQRTGIPLSKVVYIGDSITDVEAFALVRESGGMTVSFNGNRYALDAAELACLSHHSDILTVVCQLFWENGRKGIDDMVTACHKSSMTDSLLSCSYVSEILMKKEQAHPTFFEFISDNNRSLLISRSESFRRMVRGEEIGRLG